MFWLSDLLKKKHTYSCNDLDCTDTVQRSTRYIYIITDKNNERSVMCVLTNRNNPQGLIKGEARNQFLRWHVSQHKECIMSRKFLWRSWLPFFRSRSTKIITINTSPSRTVPSHPREERLRWWWRLLACTGTSPLLSAPAEGRNLKHQYHNHYHHRHHHNNRK